MEGSTMTEYVPVSPGINLSRHLRENSKNGRLTKTWVKKVMAEHPEWDWRNLGLTGGTYVNGEDAIKSDLTLMVTNNGSHVASVTFTVDVNLPVGYVAVVS